MCVSAQDPHIQYVAVESGVCDGSVPDRPGTVETLLRIRPALHPHPPVG